MNQSTDQHNNMKVTNQTDSSGRHRSNSLSVCAKFLSTNGFCMFLCAGLAATAQISQAQTRPTLTLTELPGNILEYAWDDAAQTKGTVPFLPFLPNFPEHWQGDIDIPANLVLSAQLLEAKGGNWFEPSGLGLN